MASLVYERDSVLQEVMNNLLTEAMIDAIQDFVYLTKHANQHKFYFPIINEVRDATVTDIALDINNSF